MAGHTNVDLPPVEDDEIWAPAKTKYGLQLGYQVSTHGRVFSNRIKSGGYLMKTNANNYGYLKVNMNGKTAYISEIVLHTFQGPPVGNQCAIFRDKNHNNLRLDNLQWANKNPGRVSATSLKARPVLVTDAGGEQWSFSSPNAAASFLGITRDTVYKKLKNGKPTNTEYVVTYMAVHDGITETRSIDDITDSCGGLASADGMVKKPSGAWVKIDASKRDKSDPSQEPYVVVNITSKTKREEKGKKHYVHDLITWAFIGPKPGDMVVNHKNGNTWDNRIDNLEYVTRSDNVSHAVATGLTIPGGEKKVIQYSFDTQTQIYTMVKKYRSISDAGRQLDCSPGNIVKKCDLRVDELANSLKKAVTLLFQSNIFRYEGQELSEEMESKKQRVV